MPMLPKLEYEGAQYGIDGGKNRLKLRVVEKFPVGTGRNRRMSRNVSLVPLSRKNAAGLLRTIIAAYGITVQG